MPGPATSLTLRADDRVQLERWLGSSSLRTRLVQRAQIVLLAADGFATQEIADRVGVSRPTVNLWRSRYAQWGLSGLADRDRPGRPSGAHETKIQAAQRSLGGPQVIMAIQSWRPSCLSQELVVPWCPVRVCPPDSTMGCHERW
jgi:hypothetical protein